MKNIILSLLVVGVLCGCMKTGVCPRHHIPLVKIKGYAPSRGTMADPTSDYVQYMSEAEAEYPCVTPWYINPEPLSGFRRKVSAKVCSQCNSSFDTAFAAYGELSEDVKEARFLKSLSQSGERDNRQTNQAPSRTPGGH